MNTVFSAVFFFLLLFSCLPLAAFEVESVTYPERQIQRTIPEISAPEKGVIPWETLEAVWENRVQGIGVDLRAAYSRTGLHFRVVISDPEHNNEFAERNLWRGDCFYLSLDANGDSEPVTRENPKLPPDDLTVVLGLGADGPELRVTETGNILLAPDATETPEPWLEDIIRDDDAQTTTYTFTIPWDPINSGYGIGKNLGLAAVVAHKNQNNEDTPWGSIRPTKDGPRELRYFEFAKPGEPFFSAAVVDNVTVGLEKPFARIAWAHDQPLELTAIPRNSPDADPQTVVLPATDTPQRRQIRLPQSHMTLRVEGPEGFSASKEIAITSRAQIHLEILKRLELLEGSMARNTDVMALDEQIVSDHLQAILHLTNMASERLAFQNEDMEEHFIQTGHKLLELLPEETFDFQDHVARGLPFLFLFVSDADQSMQFAMVQLPRDWASSEVPAGSGSASSPARRFPLTIYLHGMGSENPFDGMMLALDNSGQDTLFDYEKIDPDNVPPAQRGFVLAPWARGNSFYEGFGERDVWQAMEEVEKRFPIDADRRYLTGFSMGGYGALRLAWLRPHLWAGVNLASGVWPEMLNDERLENIAHLPFVMHAGELEPRFVTGGEAVREIFEQHGITHDWRVIPQMPHTYPHPLFQEAVGKVMEHTRQRPSEFTFTAQSLENREAWGIEMWVPFIGWPEENPRFTCKLEGRNIRITTRNTPSLRVDLTETGLQMPPEQDVTLYWNNEQVYQGPPKILTLGKEFAELEEND